VIFVDASALVAIVAGEDDADSLADRLEQEPARLISAISVWEAAAALCRSHTFSVPGAHEALKRYIEAGGLEYAAIGEREFGLAIQAYAEFGKGRHPAALNMGDCFAYACAKANGASLLFKGDDFAKTDIPAAFPR
jgi:ribonuclease VapC